MKIIVEEIENPDNIYWINNPRISNIHIGRIYPTEVSDLITTKSVAIYSVDALNKKEQIAQLGCVNYKRLKQNLKRGVSINLNYTYINDFTWYGTNKLYELDESKFRDIDSFSACCSFWDAEKKEDKLVTLMQLNVLNKDILFNYATFWNINFSLTNINIYNGSIYFDNSKFHNSQLSFFGITCSRGMYNDANISLNYTEFINSSLDMMLLKNKMNLEFLLSKMVETKVDINNTSNNIGEIQLTKSNLDDFNLSFCKIDSIDARECKINSLKLDGCELNGFCDFEIKSINALVFKKCLFNSVLKLDISLPNVLSFEGTINNGKIYFINIENLTNIIKNKVANELNTLQMLKENFRTIGDYENEDICYSNYRKQYNKILENNKFRKLFNNFIAIISDYGTKPYRTFLFILLLIISFAFVFYLCPYVSFNNAYSLIDYIYVSGITFFTVGYGDVLPLNVFTKIAVLIEAFFGVSTMSYFLVVLSRKVIR